VKQLFTAFAALVLAACAAMEPPAVAGRQSAVEGLVSDLAGSWSNAAQYEAAPEALKRPPAPGRPYDWLDLQHADFHAVDAPALGEHVVYLEWRSGAADGPISRQRLWVFHEDADGMAAGMDFFTFRNAEPFAGRGAEPGAFTALTEADLIGYPDGCTLQPFTRAAPGLQFEVSPQDCRIIARSGREMGISASISFTADEITYAEAGVLEEGRYAFLVPGGLAYAFKRE